MTQTYELEIDIDAPRGRVWQALTDPRELEQWFCEHAVVSPADHRYQFWGRYTPDVPTRADAPNQLVELEEGRVLSYRWPYRGGDTTVRITLEGETRVRVLHTDVPKRAHGGTSTFSHFWGAVLGDLKTLLEDGIVLPRFDYSWPHKGGFAAQAQIDAPRAAIWAAEAERWTALGGRFEEGFSFVHPAGAAVKLFDVQPNEGWSMEWNELEDDVAPGARTVLTFTLADSRGGTRFTIVHSGFDPDADIQGMATGFFSGARILAWTVLTGRPMPQGARILQEARSDPPHAAERLVALARDLGDDELAGFIEYWGGIAHIARVVLSELGRGTDARSVVSFSVGAEYTLRIAGGSTQVERGLSAEADAVVRTTPLDFVRLLNGDLPFERATTEGRLVVDGDARAAQHILSTLPVGAATD